ncbi:MAG: hypothetical protein M9962_07055 [Oligoflexia bacterium]|nr:hypothetical protein [Oligoflexia bacterium]
MRIFLFFLFSFFITNQIAFALNPTDPFKPEYKGLPFLALAPEDYNLPPEQVVGLIMARAARICEFLKLPSGRYARRNALAIQTTPYVSETAVAHLELQGGKLKLRMIKYRSEPEQKKPEVFTSFRCQGR